MALYALEGHDEGKDTVTGGKPLRRAVKGRKRGNKRTPAEGATLRGVKLGEGLPNLTAMQSEIEDMMDVLLGRVEPEVDMGTITLMEVADAYFARAMEMTYLLQQGEREGTVLKGSSHYKFRTGELRTFTEIAKRAADLGSRRLTEEQLRVEQERLGRESR